MTSPVDADADLLGEGRPLTAAECKDVRAMLDDQARAKWLWSSIRVWSMWVSGAIIGAYALAEALEKIIRRMVGP